MPWKNFECKYFITLSLADASSSFTLGKQNDMTGAYALRDEIIARGDAQSPMFTTLFQRLVENLKNEEKKGTEDTEHSEEVSY